MGAISEVSRAPRSIIDAVAQRRPSEGVFIVGVTGAVASGKSTLAAALIAPLSEMAGSPSVALIAGDGFLLPNAVLAERGLAALAESLPV